MKNERMNHLEELNHSDYKIAEDQPNIDDWKIVETSGKRVGKVKDLLFDKEAMKVRYIVTNLKNGELLEEDKNVLIPIGHAQLDRSNDRVVVPNIDRTKLTSLPTYKKVDDLTRDDEARIRRSFSGTGTGDYDQNKFYDHDDYNEERFYAHGDDRRDRDTGRNTAGKVDVVEENLEVGKREVETGGKRIKSRIVERPVEERVRLREEHVEVKRNPVDRPADSADLKNYQDRTIEEHETSEVPVVNKEARVVEEVSLEKDVDSREEVIKEDLRKTKVDVEDIKGNRDDRTGRNQGTTGTGTGRNQGTTGTGTGTTSGTSRTGRNQDGDVPGTNRDRNTDSGNKRKF